ncbi:UNVERIFIED_CONTAM: RNA polymerase II C-terminal domain phosphatase-like 3 [Sesamum radiatum]|uniref:RNA polymerase II C-terminal domain phosphatase-like n=1 Tax=Sesamum radiatum TaxID=300843 RepID=A0AAW2JBF7_SESRA
MLRKKEEQDREKPQRHLFRFPHMGMWTKLRPGIWNFLEKASKLYELHLYTMGNKYYATEMAKLLDPKGELFSGRVISRGDDGEPFDSDDRVPKSKDLEGVLGMESAVVIIDDSVRVWPHNKLNLIVVERYIYFPCSRRQFGLPGPSLLEIDHDERPEDGTLASSLAVIQRIHENFFAHQSLDEADVRNILASEQRKILAGCRIVFSRVFPVGEANPHMHPLWQTAEQFGAVCINQIDEQVTHVVANSLGTDKVLLR